MADTLVIDNFDSFTYNLVHILEAVLEADIAVKRIDETAEGDIEAHKRIVFSPGPGLPREQPHLLPLTKYAMALQKRTLGVCLGHQAMAEVMGCELKNLDTVHHGVSQHLKLVEPRSILFNEISDLEVSVGRYHSWVVEAPLAEEWRVTSRDDQGEIMSMEHRAKPFYGIQFHPESVLTPAGRILLENFLSI